MQQKKKKQAELGMLKIKKWNYICFLKDIKIQFKKNSYIATVEMQVRNVFKRAVKLLYFLNEQSYFEILPVSQQIKRLKQLQYCNHFSAWHITNG